MDTKPVVYLNNCSFKNVKCFKLEYEIRFSENNGSPALWTVLLGNNNTGKTTLLRLLSRANNTEIRTSFTEDNRWILHRKGKNKVASFSIINGKVKKGSEEYNETPLWVNQSSPSQIEVDTYRFTSPDDDAENKWLVIDAYGISRKPSESTLSDYSNLKETTKGLFFDNEPLVNVEEWLLQLDYATKKHVSGASKQLEQLKKLLLSKIFPDIEDIRFESTDTFKHFILFLTTYGWVKLQELSYGYQTSIAWIVDLAKRMFDRYPEMDNPLHGPAIVLVDEIDLHLHPEWQRKIIGKLSQLFPNTQFIVTAHSPLIVQSAQNVNLIMLEKDDKAGSINIRQQFGSFQGWTVEEILRELMDMGEKTRSDRFLSLLKDFETGLLDENYDKAKAAYDELDKILHPASSQRKLLSIQLSSLVPA